MRLTAAKLVKSRSAGQREFDCGRQHGRISRLMHVHPEKPAADPVSGETAVSEFAVGGMNCNNCARHVTEAIQGVPGVTRVDVRLEEGRATVRWQPGAVAQVENVVRAVKDAGYEATPVQERTCHDEPSGT